MTTEDTLETAATPRSEHGFINPDPAWLPDAELGIPRDPATECPLIVPPGGTEAVPYERTSRVPGFVDTLQWLMEWRLKLLAKGMAISEDLCEMASALEWNDYRMPAIIEAAHDRAGGNRKANWGTAVHSHTEVEAIARRQAERGALAAAAPEAEGHPEVGSLFTMPTRMRYDVQSYETAYAQAGAEALESEVFVVCDELRVAGTLDTIGRHPSLGLYVEDKKTGKFAAQSCAVQLAIHAHSQRVDPDLVRAGQWAERTDLGVNQERAVVAHVPKDGGSTTLKRVDIAMGWELAKLAMEVHRYQQYPSWCDPEPLGRATRGQTITAAIQAALTRPELREVMTHSEKWLTKKHRELANARWVELRNAGR